MCNTKSILMAGLAVATVYTGGAAAGVWGGITSGVGAAATTSYAGAIGMGLTGMAGAASALGQQQQLDAQQKVLERNAKSADIMATDALARGGRAEDKHRAQVRQFQGEQRVAMGAGGGLLNSGTNDAIQTDTSFAGEYDALTIRHNAIREAWGYKNQADVARYQEDLLGSQKKANLYGSILTTGAAVSGVYRRA
jgi:hypothetical protein